jgi:hypothetical protein
MIVAFDTIGVPMIVTAPILILMIALPTLCTPVNDSRITLGTSVPPRIFLVDTVNGSVVWTVFVTLNVSARPPGLGTGFLLKISGLVGTKTVVPLNTTPLLLITTG